ncbi:MAG: hypothetical protein EXS09_15615 [Gemmataceae bacterium]|nr:hypothetical protein [Gemmataceae bacterium]
MRSVFFVGLLVAIPVLAEPFSLDTIVPAKLPATMKPPKGMPSEVLAIFAPQRGDRIDCLALRPDGKYLALGGPDQNVRLWDLEKTRLAATLKLPTPVVCLAFSPDGKTLTIGDSNGNIRIHKNEGGGSYLFKSMLVAHKDMPIWSLTFSPDGGRLYSAARDKSAAVWDISKPKAVKTGSLDGHEVEVRSLSLSADGELAATAGNQDLTIRLWNLSGEKPKVAGSLKLSERVVSIGLAPDGKTLAVGGARGIPAIYERGGEKLKKLAALETGGHAATSIGYSPDGSQIVGTSGLSGTEDRVLVWDSKGAIQHEFKYGLHLHAVAFTPDGRHLIVLTESEAMIVRLPK